MGEAATGDGAYAGELAAKGEKGTLREVAVAGVGSEPCRYEAGCGGARAVVRSGGCTAKARRRGDICGAWRWPGGGGGGGGGSGERGAGWSWSEDMAPKASSGSSDSCGESNGDGRGGRREAGCTTRWLSPQTNAEARASWCTVWPVRREGGREGAWPWAHGMQRAAWTKLNRACPANGRRRMHSRTMGPLQHPCPWPDVGG